MATTLYFAPLNVTASNSTWVDEDLVQAEDGTFAYGTLTRVVDGVRGYRSLPTGPMVLSNFDGIMEDVDNADTIDGFEIEVRAKCTNPELGVSLSVGFSGSDTESQLLTDEWAIYTFGGAESTFNYPLYRRSVYFVASDLLSISAAGTLSYGASTVSIDYVRMRLHWSATAGSTPGFNNATGVVPGEWSYSNPIVVAGLPADFVAPTIFTGAALSNANPLHVAEICKNGNGRWLTNYDATADGEGSVNGDSYMLRRKMMYPRAEASEGVYPLYIHGAQIYYSVATTAVDRTMPTPPVHPVTLLPLDTLVKFPRTIRIPDLVSGLWVDGDDPDVDYVYAYAESTSDTVERTFHGPRPYEGSNGTRGPFDESVGSGADEDVGVYPGTDIEIYLQTPAAGATTETLALTLGDQVVNIDYTTRPDDIVPTQVYFATPAAVATSTVSTSNLVTIAGITGTANVTFSTSGGSAHEFQKNGGAWTAVGGGTTVVNGDTMKVRMTSPGSGSESGNVTMKIGTMHANYCIVTTGGDVTPTMVLPSYGGTKAGISGLLVTSDPDPVIGITAAQPILATVSPGFQISVNGGAFADGSSEIVLNDTITLRAYAPLQANTPITCTVTVGGRTDSWIVTSRAAHAFWN